ncbi:MAG TPA: hypothetical protein VFE08_14495 [Candidatus Sulfotelmatobacter sp.]|nr:hypothetical protein [Candidatus Sulfotelmatobacter sp.]
MEYREILERVAELSTRIKQARDRDDHTHVRELGEEIGRLYFPDDETQAERIAYLVQEIGSTNYWAGHGRGIRDYQVALKEVKAAYVPPF